MLSPITATRTSAGQTPRQPLQLAVIGSSISLMSTTRAEKLGVGFQHSDGVADRAPPDLEVAAFEAFAQRRGAQVVIDETDDPVANDGGRRFFWRTDGRNWRSSPGPRNLRSLRLPLLPAQGSPWPRPDVRCPR